DALLSTSTSTFNVSNVSNVTQVTSDCATIVEPTTLTKEDTHVQCSSLHPVESKKEVKLSDCNAKNKTDEAMSIAEDTPLILPNNSCHASLVKMESAETLMPHQSVFNAKTQQSTQVNA
ncbi:hypothetical protein HMI56_005513, partial [Coelomomyces lativittatus]